MFICRENIETACKCHGCGVISKFVKGGCEAASAFVKSKKWVEKSELCYTANGRHRRGMGFAINYYCESCRAKGINAEIVATVLLKLARNASQKRK